jgi:serine/threonine protein kinase
MIMGCKKWMKLKNFMKNGGKMLKNQIKIFKESEIVKVTENYRHGLGQGAFGSVFKGKLANGTEIAVKKALPRGLMDNMQIDQQFQSEICTISRVNHKNVVKLLGLCLESKFPMLVYEYVSNGTVFEHIHNNRSSHFKRWEFCLKIAKETASALNYLHSLADPPIIHRDVKSMNILLDSKLTAKVSDFGISVLIPPDQSGVDTTVKGTLGYLDPEYLTTKILTAKSDVYSFGVVLLELLTGLNPVPNGDPERNIIRQFKNMVEADNLSQNLNVEPADDGELEQIKEVAKLAVKCLNDNRAERPTMEDVAEELKKQMRILNGSNSSSQSNSQELGAAKVPDNKQPSVRPKGNASIQMGQFENKVTTGLDIDIRRSRSRSMS